MSPPATPKNRVKISRAMVRLAQRECVQRIRSCQKVFGRRSANETFVFGARSSPGFRCQRHGHDPPAPPGLHEHFATAIALDGGNGTPGSPVPPTSTPPAHALESDAESIPDAAAQSMAAPLAASTHTLP